MAAPASAVFAPREDKYFRVPNEFAENQAAFIPAERALALLLFRDARDSRGFTDLNGTAKISDERWFQVTGLKPRMMELAVRGLEAKGLEVSRKSKNAPAAYSWNWNKWNSAFRNIEPSNYDPKRKERDAVAAAKRVHPDCATGCAKLREFQEQSGTGESKTPFLVTSIAQPVAQTPQQHNETTEQKWAKTMAAMRAISLDVGLALLMRILAVIASFGQVADGVLAAAIRNAGKYQSSGLQKIGPVLLVKIVPNVLAAWKAKGMRLDVEPEEAPDEQQHVEPHPEPPKKKRAIDYI